jgi:hypothetical protein
LYNFEGIHFQYSGTSTINYPKKHMNRSLLTSLIVFLLLSVTARAADIEAPYGEELWKTSFEKKILWQELTDCGYLIVSTADALYCLDPATGAIHWQMEEHRKLAQDYFDVIPNTQFAAMIRKQGALGTQSKVVLLDILEGKELWDSDKFEMVNANGQFYIPEAGGMFIFGSNAKNKGVSAFVDIATGEPIWTSLELFKAAGGNAPVMFPIRQDKATGRMGIGGNQYPVATSDGNFIEFFSKQGLRKIDAKTGAVLWAWPIKTKEAPAIRNGWGSMMLNDDGSVLYVPYGETLLAVNTADGTMKWGDKGPKLKGQVQQMSLTPDGLVVKGYGKKPFINVLSYETGESIWKKPFRDLDDASSFEIEGGNIVLYANGSILSINILSGEDTEIARKIRFLGDEVPQSFEVKEDSYLLTSTNNLAKYDKEGNQLWHSYYKAPGASMLGKIASTAAVAAVNAASAADGYSRAQANAMSSPTGQGSASYSVMSNPIMSKRLKASTESNNYVYILTNVEGGSSGSTKNAGLVKINKDTGACDARVPLGTKDPEYEVDEIENLLFFQSDGAEITCYKL